VAIQHMSRTKVFKGLGMPRDFLLHDKPAGPGYWALG
jgi:hypothetical protein